MAFVRASAPDSALASIESALSELGATRRGLNALGRAQGLSVSEALPIYVLDLDEITDASCIDRARRVGWRFIVFDEQGAGFADAVDEDEYDPEATRFSRLVRGGPVDRLIEAGGMAEQAAPRGPDFEPRVLEAPSLNAAALWLAGAEPLFIPYQGVGQLLRPDPTFLSALVAQAELRRAAEEEARPSTSGLFR